MCVKKSLLFCILLALLVKGRAHDTVHSPSGDDVVNQEPHILEEPHGDNQPLNVGTSQVAITNTYDTQPVIKKFEKMFMDRQECMNEMNSIVFYENYLHKAVPEELISYFEIMISRHNVEDLRLYFKGLANGGLQYTTRAILIMMQIFTFNDLLQATGTLAKQYSADVFVENFRKVLRLAIHFDMTFVDVHTNERIKDRSDHPPLSKIMYDCSFEMLNTGDINSLNNMIDLLVETKLITDKVSFDAEHVNIGDDKLTVILNALVEKGDYETFSRILIHMHLHKPQATANYFLKQLLQLTIHSKPKKLVNLLRDILDNLDSLLALYDNIEMVNTALAELESSTVNPVGLLQERTNQKFGISSFYPSLPHAFDAKISTKSGEPRTMVANLSSEKLANKLCNLLLRNISIPKILPEKFKNSAEKNTAKNHETCGILSGKMENGNFIITHLIIPKQESTSSRCEAINEYEFVNYHVDHDLIQVGWIHTHPKFECFLSSEDLRTQFWNQLMMPEFIAIVMALEREENGVFHITPIVGMDAILYNEQKRLPLRSLNSEVYQIAEHYKLVENTGLEVVDFR